VILSRGGQSFLALVLLIGSIVVAVGLTISTLANSFLDTGFGYESSVIAQSAATSGAEDALLRLDRNASFSSSGYPLVVGSTTVMVSITQNSPSTNLITVSSTATVSSRTRTIGVILANNTTDGQLTVIWWQLE
jgi:hypothetical protein